MSSTDWRQLFLKIRPEGLDIKALLRATLTEKQWEAVAIAESEKGYGFTAPLATMHQIYRVLGVVPPAGFPSEQMNSATDEFPNIEGFEPPRAVLSTTVRVTKLRPVVVVPVARGSQSGGPL